MAQEVERIMPEAVVRGENGYLRVSYARLGFAMQRYENWLAAGARIPSVLKTGHGAGLISPPPLAGEDARAGAAPSEGG
jgi:hypothetical protein